MKRFKKEKIIVKSSIGENLLGSFFKTKKGFKKLDEVNNAEGKFKMKKN